MLHITAHVLSTASWLARRIDETTPVHHITGADTEGYVGFPAGCSAVVTRSDSVARAIERVMSRIGEEAKP